MLYISLEEYSPFEEKDGWVENPWRSTFRKRINDYFDDLDHNSNVYLYDSVNDLKIDMDLVYSRDNVLFSIDVEAWEKKTSKVTELGVAIYDPRGQELSLSPHIDTFHIIISENMDLRNSRRVPDHKDNFIGAVTYCMAMEDAAKFVQSLVNYYFDLSNVGCCLVGHDAVKDIKWFAQVGIEFADDIYIVDTKELYSYSHGYRGCSLANVLHMVQIPSVFLHNAGNDAYYTLLAAMKLCDPDVRESLFLDDEDKSLKHKNRTLPQSLTTANQRKIKIRENTSFKVAYNDAEVLLDDLYFY